MTIFAIINKIQKSLEIEKAVLGHKYFIENSDESFEVVQSDGEYVFSNKVPIFSFDSLIQILLGNNKINSENNIAYDFEPPIFIKDLHGCGLVFYGLETNGFSTVSSSITQIGMRIFNLKNKKETVFSSYVFVDQFLHTLEN